MNSFARVGFRMVQSLLCMRKPVLDFLLRRSSCLSGWGCRERMWICVRIDRTMAVRLVLRPTAVASMNVLDLLHDDNQLIKRCLQIIVLINLHKFL